MLDIPGYRVDRIIYTSSHSTVCRGQRERDDRAVIIKFTRVVPPSPDDVARFNREWTILEKLGGGTARPAFDRIRYHNRLALVMDDIGARSLAECLTAARPALAAVLDIAIATVDSLTEIHRHHIIHKDINPSNIIWNQETGEVRIIDFNLSSVFEREMATAGNLEVLEGSLGYIAPEQTGRMNRAVDYRADFYSLGATLYELLVGQRPFTTQDVTELIHAQLAVDPVPPHLVDPAVPAALSAIVMKLLGKEPEARYQSGHGLRSDLARCQSELSAHGRIAPFAIASSDIPDHFRIPGRLYGRERACDELASIFEEVLAGKVAITLVSGYAGIGKSSLVHELYKPITRARGHFMAGKYDQYQRTIPYSAIVAAFEGLLRELLGAPEEILCSWRDAFRDALGPNGALLIEVIPEIELVTGPQPPVQALGPIEAKARFNRVFLAFMQMLCRAGRPLVLFLDDLQWADSASLELIELLASSDELGYLHIVGAYRDNEVSPEHPLVITTDRIARQHGRVRSIELAPLAEDHIASLLVDALHSDRVAVQPLAELVSRKTSGNPFFINQFLTALHDQEVLVFDHQGRRWAWDLARVGELGITDNVVDLLVSRLSELPATTTRFLEVAACIGNRFDTETLAWIQRSSILAVHDQLVPALAAGYIVPLSEPEPVGEDMDARLVVMHYRFMHDRVQQAAHSMLDDRARKIIHATIGRRLLDNLSSGRSGVPSFRSVRSPDERAERIFQIVDHLDAGRELITDSGALRELCELELEAGRKAKDATAYAAAIWYIDSGIALLPVDAWQSQYELSVALHTIRGELAYLVGNFDESRALFDLLLEKVRTPLEQAGIYNLFLVLLGLAGNYREAVAMGRLALGLVGVELPESDFAAALERELARVRENVGARAITELAALPEATRPEDRIAIRVLARLGPITYLSDQDLFPIVTIRSVNLSIERGQMAESSIGYCNYGLIASTRLGEYQKGYDFACLARQVSARFNDLPQTCISLMMIGYVLNHWVRPLAEADLYYDESYRAGLDSGEYTWIGYLVSWKVYLDLHQGKPLPTILADASRALGFCRRAKHQMASLGIAACQIVLCNLNGQTSGEAEFCTESMTEAELLALSESQQQYTVLCYYLATRAQALYLYGNYRAALTDLVRSGELLSWIPGTFSVSVHCFYHSLTLLAVARAGDDALPAGWSGMVAENQSRMQSWRESCPHNFESMYLLVEAERAALAGDEYQAVKLYNQAIESASQSGFLHTFALAHELAARFWLALGNDTYGRVHASSAARAYQAWGATRKAALFVAEHALLLEHHPALPGEPAVPHAETSMHHVRRASSSSSVSTPELFDVVTVIKASQAISGEIVLDALLRRLLDIVIESVGAERGCVVIPGEQGRLRIEVAASARDDEDVERSYPIAADAGDPETGTPLLPQSILNYVSRTGHPVVLHNAAIDSTFASDPYVASARPRSLLCTPITSRGSLAGLLYLENNLVAGAFTTPRVDALQLLLGQISISLENAELYRANERARYAAEAANRAKSAFLATMSHELRTPLNVIIGYIELLHEECKDKGLIEMTGDLAKILSSAHHLTSVLGDILDLARIEAGRVEVDRAHFNMHTLVAELEDTIQPLLATGRNQFTVTLAGEFGEIYSDKLLVRQMLLNLLGNACKFTRDGEIGLAVQCTSAADGRWLVCKVSDTGVGIPADKITDLFDPFTQADSSTTRRYGGVGLGLTICRNLAEVLGGSVAVDSAPGKGSTFTLRLPA